MYPLYATCKGGMVLNMTPPFQWSSFADSRTKNNIWRVQFSARPDIHRASPGGRGEGQGRGALVRPAWLNLTRWERVGFGVPSVVGWTQRVPGTARGSEGRGKKRALCGRRGEGARMKRVAALRVLGVSDDLDSGGVRQAYR
jgi:hypothetical protein